jgi:hypothetical protein
MTRRYFPTMNLMDGFCLRARASSMLRLIASTFIEERDKITASMSSQTEKSKGVFIGWSGSRTRDVAQALGYWLKCLSLDVEPWVSTVDLRPGRPWWEELEVQLQSSDAGILCISPDNVNSPWLHFEAGALARSVARKLIIPYAIDMDPSAIPHPIGFFQAAAANHDDTFRMISGLFASILVEYDRDSNILDVFWPFFKHVLDLRESNSEAVQTAITRIKRIANVRRGTKLNEVLFPKTAKRGETLTLEYVVETKPHDVNDVNIWLGASIELATGEWFFCKEEDAEVSLNRGVRRFHRNLTLSERIPAGEYDFNAELWFGVRGEEFRSYPIQHKWPVGKIRVE